MATYIPKGVCSKQIDFDIDAAGLVHNIHFTKGCPGNTVGIARLAEGQPAEQLIELLKGLPCGFKKTSCPDQFALALEEELAKQQ
ncbi:MAG: TIGR03905 family TSCPD domain-containing protein [Coriobacteriales bacterium]|nr:TIGR03905 family TSCPD domain-containing protein [Coriobacteriales bacterium]